ncbi:hypothetical protein [Brevibacillus laterosporus]|uniref:Uncharacterized protein n=1 Tax=Brevibacillus laterosporus TaxID=1465 RepID=A0AAP3DHS5_BRELA|nr:hypothetical protein [Brevibacillus laterosporus]MCR8981604.1 hypothetical protein [Brevibacillus laterosporus]MCZ0808759.1 hypothetical protein [Brevibacillus laterosporus]MCZ0827268.1 hypothetical protein [Brevibacillus laterosporus]MCZ0851024.1 hypothetical protein [Brevibacillus laterosporus]
MKEMLDGLDEEELYHIAEGMLDLSKISRRNGDKVDAQRKEIIARKVSDIKVTRQFEQAQRILNRGGLPA